MISQICSRQDRTGPRTLRRSFRDFRGPRGQDLAERPDGSSSFQGSIDVACPVEDADDVDALIAGPVENDGVLESLDFPNPYVCEPRIG